MGGWWGVEGVGGGGRGRGGGGWGGGEGVCLKMFGKTP